MSFEELRESVLGLSVEQRAEMVELLLETLPDEAPPGLSIDDPAFYEELDRRMAEKEGWKNWEEIRDED